MITVLVYLIIALVLCLLWFRLSKILKEDNLYARPFFNAVMLSAIGQLVSMFFIVIFLFTNNNTYLHYSNAFSWLFFYLGASFIIKVPLILFFRKFKSQNLATYLIAFWGVVVFVWHFFIDYDPYINSANIIQWEVPPLYSLIFGIPLLIIWLFVSGVFVRDYIISGLKSTKSLFIGLGFFLAAMASVFQDFGVTALEYFSINMIMAIGFLLVLAGLFAKSGKSNL